MWLLTVASLRYSRPAISALGQAEHISQLCAALPMAPVTALARAPFLSRVHFPRASRAGQGTVHRRMYPGDFGAAGPECNQ